MHLPAEPVWLHADPSRLSQVLANLLNNAAKFTEQPGHIGITAETGDGAVTVTVSDTGRGIPPALQREIFDVFVQERPPGGGVHGGLGLGLTVVRSLVALHGGTVRAESEGPGRGSRFILRLPTAAARSEGEPDGPGPSVPEVVPRRILVVDDNRDAADSLRTLLAGCGHRVVAVYDGEQALRAARDLAPEVVLLDLGMPAPDGYATARRLRRQPGGGRLTLVALTGWGQDADRQRTREAGFDHHLVKPAGIEQLHALLSSLPAPAADEPSG